jgi:hypothetical protein
MIKPFIFPFILLLYSCVNPANSSKGEAQTETYNWNDETDTSKKQNREAIYDALIQPTTDFYVYTSSEVEFNKAKKSFKNSFVADTSSIKKKKNQLILRFKNGRKIAFQDKIKSEEFLQIEDSIYTYLGQFPVLNHYLVKGQFYENTEYYFINKTNGKSTELAGFPVVSENNLYLANTNEMGGFMDEKFGFQIHKLHSITPYLIEILNDFKWYPLDFTWDKDNNLLVKIIDCTHKDFTSGKFQQSKNCIFLRLEFL